MRVDPVALDIARAQFERLDAPTAIVPIECDGVPGVVYASYQGNEEWMALARQQRHQEELAICVCKLAHAEARREGLQMRGAG